MENRVIEMDVREDIKNNSDPFQKIMETIAELKEHDSLVLHAPFQPVPLFAVMKAKGFEYDAVEIDSNHWKITFMKK
ncbi:DUF2249 domain-containing protein [Bacillus sp. 1NLA3E]|uniref:DUF2249 domain-containing protein n=1 Tax=Bacillus sp. 1NLA3E TaxID=666686 RepID=UPI000247F4B4|nr:DUF2249 domain-containing protein [Bacillus sp. 1NLA3E]AGK54652.1 hypothetical protein B1NLA3E_14530 [Bacillus sp. 1NLA3E]